MKYILKFIVFTTILFLFNTGVYAEENIVNIYFFHSNTCSHCQKEKKLLKNIEKEHSNVHIYMYEINNIENSKIFSEITNLLDVKTMGVPFTIIGDKSFNGYSEENSKKNFEGAISYYSKYGSLDKVGEYLNINPRPNYNNQNDISIEDYIKDFNNYTINVPLLGKIETKKLTLPLVSFVLGLIDGFNPCAMWVLLFLISMLLGMENKKRMWALGISFLVASSITYLLFMIAWLNVASLLNSIFIFRLFIALVALGGGLFNVYSYFKHRKETGCTVTSDEKRNKIFTKIKKFTLEKNFFLAIIGVITLGASVNIIELACSAGLPIIFSEILSLNNLTIVEEIIYIAIYLICFFLDDLIIFILAMTTLKLTGLSTKYGKITKIIGGILLIIIGILMLIKPSWIMFNFN